MRTSARRPVTVGVLAMAVLLAGGCGDADADGPSAGTTSSATSTSAATASANTSTDPSAASSESAQPEALGLSADLIKRDFECSDLSLAGGSIQRGCFRSTGGVRSEVLFQYGSGGVVAATRIRVLAQQTAKSRSAYDVLLAAVGGSLFQPDLAAVRKLSPGGAKNPTADGTWGSYELEWTDLEIGLMARRHGTEVAELPNRKVTSVRPAAFFAAMTRKGHSCSAEGSTCTREPAEGVKLLTGVNVDGDEIADVTLISQGTDASFRKWLATLGQDVHGSLAPADDDLREWISRNLDGRDHQAYVGGLLLTYEFRSAASNVVAHYNLRIARTGRFL